MANKTRKIKRWLNDFHTGPLNGHLTFITIINAGDRFLEFGRNEGQLFG